MVYLLARMIERSLKQDATNEAADRNRCKEVTCSPRAGTKAANGVFIPHEVDCAWLVATLAKNHHVDPRLTQPTIGAMDSKALMDHVELVVSTAKAEGVSPGGLEMIGRATGVAMSTPDWAACKEQVVRLYESYSNDPRMSLADGEFLAFIGRGALSEMGSSPEGWTPGALAVAGLVGLAAQAHELRCGGDA